MASILRGGVVNKKPEIKLSGEVECDEVYVIAGQKGNSPAVKKATLRPTKPFTWRERVWNVRKREATIFHRQ
jgi:hypothetical protein